MKKLILSIFTLFCFSNANDDLKPFENLKGTLNIAGGTAHIASEKEAMKNIMEKYPQINMTIAGGGTGVGIKQVTEGLVDIANAGRAPKKDEIERGNLQSFVFAMDGIAVIVNNDLNTKNLTTEQLVDIFTGKVKSFNELGLNGGKINLYVRDASSGTMEVFTNEGIKKAQISQDAKVVSSNAAMKTAVLSDKNGIGFISFGTVDDSVKAICIDDKCPSTETILNGDYHISRGLYMVTKGEPKPLAKAFIEYMKSNSGAEITSKLGLIPYQK
ncbi:phosphate ABC transporter substrate-binding protein [Aliarcobacter vitoriensis]|uniref:Phosphate-binding protein n=1 Tax=Aliarcobacter vitoriensis TaxID=2011099 RepID=A0A366MRS9_9BACT|nr:phosphate ABC transporter substrate-binding protein [Aliarcobacter vitoriensis]RBQ28998.1 phosphate-binding protein [Aliarcobacter vitoriensis]